MAEHIKVPEIVPPSINYFLTEPTANFVAPFTFFNTSDLVVKVDGFVQVLDLHYIVLPTGGYDKGFPGGLVAFFVDVPAGSTVFIDRRVPIARNVDFPNAGPLQTATLNTELDKIVCMIQQTEGDVLLLDARVDILELGDPRLGRAMLFPPEDENLNHSLPSIGNRAEQVLGFAADGEIKMLSALIDPVAARNVMLPDPAARANKVLGWDVTGFDFDMISVVAGELVPNAGNIAYIGVPSIGISRSVENRLRERLSIKDFGTGVGVGNQTADDAALAAAITYINGLSTNSITLFYPDGIYVHGPCAVKLLKESTTIQGNASSVISFKGTGPWLIIGNSAAAQSAAVARFRLDGLNFDFSTATSGAILARLDNTTDSWFSNLRLKKADTFLQVGPSTGNAGAFNTNVVNCSGTSRNFGRPLFNLKFGGGLFLTNLNFAVDFSPSSRPTAQGNHFLNSSVVSFTRVRLLQCYCLDYDGGLVLNVNGGGAASDYIVSNCTFTGCQRWAVYIEHGNNGTVTDVRVLNNQLDCFDQTCITLANAGGNTVCNNLSFNDNVIRGAGGSAFTTSSNASTIGFSRNRLSGLNKKGAADAAIQVSGGTGFSINENSGNLSDTATRCPVGIRMGGGTDFFTVQNNRMGGTVASIVHDPDGLLSSTRRIHNNLFASSADGGYANIVPIGLDGAGRYGNTTPYVIAVSLSGGGMSYVAVNGIRLLWDPGPITVMVEPGDVVDADGSPTVIARIMA